MSHPDVMVQPHPATKYHSATYSPVSDGLGRRIIKKK